MRIGEAEGQVFVHPFADPLVIAGQGTISLELLANPLGRQIDTLLCPIGGGGLIGGIAAYIKETRPEIAIIGVEAESCPAMEQALRQGGPVRLERAASLADGIAVKQVGQINYELARNYVDEVITVTEDELANAILLLLEIEKIVVEGAGAAPLAAILKKPDRFAGRQTLSIVSGGNIDVNILHRIITRGLTVAGRSVELNVRLRDIPGALMASLAIIKRMQANILNVSHHRFNSPAPFGYVDVSLTLETKGHDHIQEIEEALQAEGYLVWRQQEK